MKIDQNKLLIGIIISMMIWGISWSSAKVISGYANAQSLAFIRYLIVVLTFIPLLPSLKIKYTISKAGIPRLIGAGIFMACYTLLFFQGLKLGKSGAAGVLVTTLNPIFAYGIGLFISKKRPSKRELLGLGVGILAGIILLDLYHDIKLLTLPQNYIFITAAFIWAVMAKFSSKADNYGHPLTFSFWINIITLLGITPFVDFGDVEHLIHTADSTFWWNILYFGIINSTFATSCYLLATVKLGAEKASSFIFLVPACAALSSWLFLGEVILVNTIIGGILGMFAVLLINKKKSNP